MVEGDEGNLGDAPFFVQRFENCFDIPDYVTIILEFYGIAVDILCCI